MCTHFVEFVDKDFCARKFLCAAEQRLAKRVLTEMHVC
jgi:hypothetical protein